MEIFLLSSHCLFGQHLTNILVDWFNEQFQKISIPIPRTAFRISEGEGGSLLWNSAGMGGIYNWKSKGIGGFHRWDFWSRKCRVSSLKMLIAVDFCSS